MNPQTQHEVDKSGGRVREMFRQIAPRYDLMNHVLSANLDRLWRRRLVRSIDPHSRGPLLDVCTGTGDVALALARRAPGAEVVGCDFCHEMLQHGVRKRESGSQRVVFVEGDAMQLPFRDDTFQEVTVAFGLRNVADTDAGLREMVRVCRPGGRVSVLEFAMPTVPVVAPLYSFYFHRILPRIGQLFAHNDKQAYAYLPESVGQFPQRADLTRRMDQAGLQGSTFRVFSFGVCCLYWGIK